MTIGLMNAIITERSRDARVVELADSLDSGSSAHSGRAGSSPASRTTFKARNRKISGLFYISKNFSGEFIFRRFSLFFDKGPISNVFLTLF